MSSGNSNKNLMRAIVIWGLATLFYFYDNLLQISPSAMKPELSLAFVRDAEQFGSLSAYCLYAYGLMQIPAGLLMDRFGPRRLITLACTLCAIGSLLFGVATGLWEAKLGRLMIGIGAAFAFVSCLKLANIWFSANRFALMIGLTATVGFLGAAFGLSTVSRVVELFGWRESMQWGGWFGLLLAVALWLIVRDRKPTARAKSKNKNKGSADHLLPTTLEASIIETCPEELTHFNPDISVWRGLIEILTHRETWIVATYAGLMFVPTLAFGGLWGIPFLVEAHGFDRTTAGFCVSLIYIGWMFGSPAWGWLSDYLGRRNLPMMIANVMTFIICVVIIYGGHFSTLTLQILLFSLGFFSSGFILAFAVVREFNPPYAAGTAIGFTNALNTFFGAIAQPIIGKILDMNASGAFPNGAERVFSLAEYQFAFMVIPICLVMAFLLLLCLKESHCHAQRVA